MTPLQVLIVDDESLAADVIETYATKFPQLKVVARAENAVDAFAVLQNISIDLMFLDIQMPSISGISFLKSLKKAPLVVFTTAYDNYAVEGFELDAVDYLLKPIPFDRFMQAVNKVLQHNSLPEKSEHQYSFNNQYDEAFIYLKEDKLMVKVLLNEVLYVESLKNYVKVVTKNKTVVTHSSISSMEQRLPMSKFLRVHRSFIIAISKVEAFDTSHFEIADTYIPIGRNYKESVAKTMDSLLDGA